eukprot:TRINITY_DN18323_c0_g1_i2.p1 TRINITY_DN18323_c0_g1~~TRINITY_DN18323_c0_g1_i2.p1  ORF type:complete len:248 (+),score=88.78 TRINITY_DN18323_c0_g1_i2:67-744(+)
MHARDFHKAAGADVTRQASSGTVSMAEDVQVECADGGSPAMSPRTRMQERRRALSRTVVFGGVDGLSTTATLVWGAAAVGETAIAADVLLVIGIANLVAKACSMAVGDYFGSQAERKITNAPVDQAYSSGLLMFASFVFFGGFPLICLAPLPFLPTSLADRRSLLGVLTVASLVLLGLIKARLTATSHVRSAAIMVAAGLFVVWVSYIVGQGVHHVLGAAEPSAV